MPSSRRRLGVALLLDEPLRSEVEGLRRAVGDPSLGRMPPHLTLVPPVNVRPAEMPAALGVLKAAAGSQPGPLVATLGPPATFLPHNPVLYLEVGGDLERLAGLRDRVFEPPLARVLTWPWVPHVTVGDGVDEGRIATALGVLRDWTAATVFDRVVLLEERAGRVWVPIADACLGPPVTVGTGGRALTITRGRIVDPEALDMMDNAERPGRRSHRGADNEATPAMSLFGPPIVLSARTAEGMAGVAGAWIDHAGAHVGVFVDARCRRQGVGGHLLAQLESAARSAGWDFPALLAEGPPAFYESRSAWARPVGPTAAVTRTRRRHSGTTS